MSYMNANVNARCMCEANLRFRVTDSVFRLYSVAFVMHVEYRIAMRHICGLTAH